MKYVPPYGVSDPEASYTNGDPTVGRQGSIPPAAAFENPQREIMNVITKNLFAPSDADLQQLVKAIRSARVNYCEDAGTPGLIQVALDPALTAYTHGLVLHVLILNTNVTAGVRINAGPGIVPVRKMNGADVRENELSAGAIASMVYNGNGGFFQLINFGGGAAPGVEIRQVQIPYARDTGTPNNVRALFGPPYIDQLKEGDLVAVKIRNTNTGPIMLTYNPGLPAVPMLPNGGGGEGALQGDIRDEDVLVMVFDGNAFWFQPNPEINAWVQYLVGPGERWTNIAQANTALKRKTIGATGYVRLFLKQRLEPYTPITWSHPDSDRAEIMGEMLSSIPNVGEMARNGTSAAQRAQDSIFNFNLLNPRYGTQIRISPGGGVGLRNQGPGRLKVRNLFIHGSNPVSGYAASTWSETGVQTQGGEAIDCYNVMVSRTHNGFLNDGGSMWLNLCYANVVDRGFLCIGGNMWCVQTAAFGSFVSGYWGSDGASVWGQYNQSYANERYGMVASSSAAFSWWWSVSTGNGMLDAYSSMSGNITFVSGAGGAWTSTFNNTSPWCPPGGGSGSGNNGGFIGHHWA